MTIEQNLEGAWKATLLVSVAFLVGEVVVRPLLGATVALWFERVVIFMTPIVLWLYSRWKQRTGEGASRN